MGPSPPGQWQAAQYGVKIRCWIWTIVMLAEGGAVVTAETVWPEPQAESSKGKMDSGNTEAKRVMVGLGVKSTLR